MYFKIKIKRYTVDVFGRKQEVKPKVKRIWSKDKETFEKELLHMNKSAVDWRSSHKKYIKG